MATINIFKINSENENELIEELLENYEVYDLDDEIEIDSKYLENINCAFSMHLYLNDEQRETGLSWNWIREQFGLDALIYTSKPKGILLINETQTNTITGMIKENVYAVSFGYAHHILKQYSDREWPIRFAEHITLNKVKSMTILSPNSIINRKINNYVNFKDILLNSGEALNQLNAYLDLDDDFDDFKERISISNSISFEVKNPTLNSLAHIIDYIAFISNSETIINSIPYFKEIKNKTQEDTLNQELKENIFRDIEDKTENPCIDLCDFIMVDTYPKFISQFENFKLKYQSTSKDLDLLTTNEIYEFISENLDENDDILGINVSFDDEETGESKEYDLTDLIIYDSPNNNYLFEEGVWWAYNGKYLQDLKESIDEIEVIYEEEFDFDENEYLTFVRQKAHEENINFDEATEEIQKEYKKKWYKERVFNLLRENEGYICNDRYIENVDNSKIEVADLFKLEEKSMFSVKIGSASNLIYVIDQSLFPLKMIDNGEIRNMENERIKELNKKDIENVYLWLVLTRKRKLPIRDGKPDLNEINSITLKNRIDYWKKEVIMSRRNPKIRINYISF